MWTRRNINIIKTFISLIPISLLYISAMGDSNSWSVGANLDDAYMRASYWYEDQTTLSLGLKNDYYRNVGLRFTNITIPQGATIDTAWLEFYWANDQAEFITVSVHCEDTADATTFADSADYVDRWDNLTTDSVVWSIEETTNNDWDTSDLINSPVQEIINRSDWSSGNDIMILLRTLSGPGGYTKEFDSYEAGTYIPKLRIVWTESTGNPQVIIIQVD